MAPDATGTRADAIPPNPFGDGLLCVSPAPVGTQSGFWRFGVQSSGVFGTLSEGPGIVLFASTNFGSGGQIVAGHTWHFQAWFRDPGTVCAMGYNLSNGLAVTFSL